jgi:hypothetical protein
MRSAAIIQHGYGTPTGPTAGNSVKSSTPGTLGGCIVHIHEVIEKAAGEVLRCSRDDGAPDRWLELPVWMFDRAACVPMQVAARPHVGLATLLALWALLGEVVGGDQTSSNAPDWGAARESHDPNRGDAHATPGPSSPISSLASSSTAAVPIAV